MIPVHRITIGTDLTFEKAAILDASERSAYPNFFEDSNFIFMAPDGIRCLPYYNISVIEFDKIPRVVKEGIKAKRISIGFNLSYGPITIIPPEYYVKYGIPVILPITDQFVFVTKEGTYITPDYNINYVKL